MLEKLRRHVCGGRRVRQELRVGLRGYYLRPEMQRDVPRQRDVRLRKDILSALRPQVRRFHGGQVRTLLRA